MIFLILLIRIVLCFFISVLYKLVAKDSPLACLFICEMGVNKYMLIATIRC